ncbi:MAG: hypothetical protein A3K59_02980 [Euryarchaeota archaeon RBG_19FT_COMBO_69_17]|nr:MAG: hypothetical protein A3K59_02980 [Euryarchaeota archaeon RBG_19FT_COMBO_69_17]
MRALVAMGPGSSMVRSSLDRIARIAAIMVLLLVGEYLLFVLLAMSYGGTLSGAGGSPGRFALLFVLLALFDVLGAASLDGRLRTRASI